MNNHLKIAYRSLLKNKGYTAINIIGLSTAIVAVLFIGIWIHNQFLYDNFYPNKTSIYKLFNRSESQGQIHVSDITMAPAAAILKSEYPEVEYSARLYWSTESLITTGDTKVKSEGNEVDPDFIKIFSFPVVEGSSDNMLNSPNNIVLTAHLAKSLFGDTPALNKVVQFDSGESYKVSGVLEDLPSYTDFNFKYLVPLSENKTKDYGSNWNTNTYYTFLRLKAGSDVEQFNTKISSLVRDNAADLKGTSVFLYPQSKTHLYSKFKNGVPNGGKIDQIRLVGVIGLLILIIACINFVNLSTARAQKRSKEVGVRKIVGATKFVLVQQFLTESILLTIISGTTALFIALGTLPLFNRILGQTLFIEWSNPIIWAILLLFLLLTGLLAGIYPAFVLSTIQPIKSLKVNIKRSRLLNFREVLVILQFSIAVILIIATMVIRQQITFAGEREVGYHADQLIEIPIEGNIEQHYQAIKTELLNNRTASHITRTGWTVTADNASSSGNFSWEKATPDQQKNTVFTILRISGDDFVPTLGLTLLEGRDINYENLPADSTAVLLNETAIKTMGLENPIGKYFKWGDATFTIVGIVKDYISGSPYQPVRPLLIHPSKRYLQSMLIRTNEQFDTRQNLAQIETVIKKFNPNYPFNYQFVNEQFARKFKQQEQIGNLTFVFSLLAIIISCLGLFGLAAYITETRTKEIGIRKVLGASINNINILLSKDFIKLVIIAILIGTPIAWWGMNQWLKDFAYRIHIGWWLIASAGIIAVIVALVTVNVQSLRAARTNPIKSLRDE
ncbi:ABC transporter permease [Sphingobacterium yanglingense]|uniref:Putative permease n=1 Tax=Sphingobacterium yanglingense TaxID=1437280 RepID=A0A4R6WEB5_9SPHI|nr:ABC transporter permease [Sphingobacterium yanglingense]TDQ76512.1 putative permease [Sphingobacterium yanglingense]